MTKLQLMSYATRDTDSVRVPVPLTVWFLVSGIAAGVAVTADLMRTSPSTVSMAMLGEQRFAVSGWQHVAMRAYAVRTCVSWVAAWVLLAAFVVAVRRGWRMGGALQVLIRIAGVLFIVASFAGALNIAESVLNPRPIRGISPSLFWAGAVRNAFSLFVLPVLVLGASFRTFHADHRRMQILLGLVLIGWGLAGLMWPAEEGLFWAFGLPPDWVQPVDRMLQPKWSTFHWICVDVYRWVARPLAWLVPVFAVGSAVVIFRDGPRKAWWLRSFAVAMAVSLLAGWSLTLLNLAAPDPVARLSMTVFNTLLMALLPLAAWLSAGRDASS